MPRNTTQFLKSLNDSFPKSILGRIKCACSVPILLSSYLLLASPVRTTFLIRFPNASQTDAYMQNKPNNCTAVTSVKESSLSPPCFKPKTGLYGLMV